MNLVPLCSTMVAPSRQRLRADGRGERAVHHHLRTGCAAAAAQMAGTSATSSVGLVGVSTHTTSAPGAAATTAAVSAMSTNRTSRRACSHEVGDERAHAQVRVGGQHQHLRRQREQRAGGGGHARRERQCIATLQRPDAASSACQVGVPCVRE